MEANGIYAPSDVDVTRAQRSLVLAMACLSLLFVCNVFLSPVNEQRRKLHEVP